MGGSILELPLCRDHTVHFSWGATVGRARSLAARTNQWPLLGWEGKVHLWLGSRSPAPESFSLFRTPTASTWVPSAVTLHSVPGVHEYLPARWQAPYSDLWGSWHSALNITITQNICVDQEYETNDICEYHVKSHCTIFWRTSSVWGQTLELRRPMLSSELCVIWEQLFLLSGHQFPHL